MMKNVFLIGAMKCGTNTLYHALKNHPKIAIPETKELDYFLGKENTTPYADCFELTGETEVTLDGTTQYSKYPGIRLMPEAIYAMNPDARIVYIMRDPLNRLESNVAHNIARGSGASIEDWRESKVLENAINYSRYYTQISLYTRLFPRENIFLGVFENFVQDQKAFIDSVCEFLELNSSDVKISGQVRNQRRKDNDAEKLKFTAEDDVRFAHELKTDIDCLKHAFNIDTLKYWERYEKGIAHA